MVRTISFSPKIHKINQFVSDAAQKRELLTLLLLIIWATFARAQQIQFGSPVKYILPDSSGSVSGIVAVDLNRDTRVDIALTGPQGLMVMLNNGDGTFGAAISYSIPGGSGTTNLKSADVNLDGYPDLIAESDYGGNVYVYLNRGNGLLNSPTVYSIGFRGKGLAVGNFDGDGIPDIIASANGILKILHGNGDGTFSQPYSSLSEQDGFQAADLNGDGLDDLYFSNFSGGGPAVMLNQGQGKFGGAITTSGFGVENALLAVDIHNNGTPDLIGVKRNDVDASPPSLVDYQNDGKGSFPTAKLIPADVSSANLISGYDDLVAIDIDGDGLKDLVVLGWRPNRIIEVFRNNGNGFDTPQTFVTVNNDSDYQLWSAFNPVPVAADVDGDGRQDILFTNWFNPFTPDSVLYVILNKTPIAGGGTAVSAILPDHGGSAGTVSSVEIIGTGFPADVQVSLTGPGPDIKPASFTVSAAGNLITANFDLTNTTPGAYTLVLKDKNGNVLLTKPGAFTVQQGGAPDIWVDFVGRSVIRAGKSQTFYILVGNRGSVDSDVGEIICMVIPSVLGYSMPQLSEIPAATAQVGSNTVLLFQAATPILVGATLPIPINLSAPDDAQYAHFPIEVTVWKGSR